MRRSASSSTAGRRRLRTVTTPARQADRSRLQALSVVVLLLAGAQGDAAGFLGDGRQFYRPVAGPVAPTDVLVGVLVAWAVADARARTVLPRLPAALVGACLAVLLAAATGAVTGWQAGARSDVIFGARCSVYLAVVPIAVASLLWRSQLEAATRTFTAGGAVVAAIGLTGFVLAQGPVIPNGPLVTFTEAGALWWVLMVVLTTACLVAIDQRPRLVRILIGLLALLVLALSLRRGFILAALLTLPAAGLIAASAEARRFVLLLAAALVATAVLVAAFLPANRALQPPGAEAVLTFQESRSRGDRYRRAELANVWANIRRSPVYGLGLGVPWRTYEPMPAQYTGFRNYVHAALLWYWLKMGLLGALAYLGYIAAAAWCGRHAWRSGSSPQVRAFGLATSLSVIALLFVELTATQSGVDVRLALVMGLAIGICAAAGLGGDSRYSRRRTD
jgi:O-antigen ligase